MQQLVEGYLSGFLDGREAMKASKCLSTSDVAKDLVEALKDFE